MKTRLPILACLLAALGSTQAAIYTANLDGQAFTVVEIDPFPSGGTEGNTGRTSGSGTFWSTTTFSNTDGLWRERTGSGFGYSNATIPGATDRLFEISQGDLTGAPALRQTVTGLVGDTYQVVILYVARNDTTTQDQNGVIRASLNEALGGAGTFTYSQSNASSAALGSASVWSVYYGELGTTGPAATGFTVDFGGLSGYSRTDAIGVAYRAIPEPSSLTLLGIGALMMVRRRR